MNIKRVIEVLERAKERGCGFAISKRMVCPLNNLLADLRKELAEMPSENQQRMVATELCEE